MKTVLFSRPKHDDAMNYLFYYSKFLDGAHYAPFLFWNYKSLVYCGKGNAFI